MSCGVATSPLMPLANAASWLGVSIKTVKGYVDDGDLRYINVGRGKKNRRMMFTEGDLQEFVERRAQRETPCQFIVRKVHRSTTSISNSKVIGFTALRRQRTDAKPKA
ncbi:helix-turn-helix domain-containing protein [Nitrobacter vulgaris]|uniref:helix-turn-helix domain-containing protein n=1 Tax=Nitrobacter vulgaris TaxID=29421 RepID=UPI0035B50AEE